MDLGSKKKNEIILKINEYHLRMALFCFIFILYFYTKQKSFFIFNITTLQLVIRNVKRIPYYNKV